MKYGDLKKAYNQKLAELNILMSIKKLKEDYLKSYNSLKNMGANSLICPSSKICWTNKHFHFWFTDQAEEE